MARRAPTAPTLDACPRCGWTLGVAAERPIIEKPFAECPSCGGFVARTRASEWALYGTRIKLDFCLRAAVRSMTAGLVVLMAFLVVSLVGGRGQLLLGGLIAFGAGALAGGAWEGARLRARILRSRRRMGDPMYLAKLGDFEWHGRPARGAAEPDGAEGGEPGEGAGGADASLLRGGP